MSLTSDLLSHYLNQPLDEHTSTTLFWPRLIVDQSGQTMPMRSRKQLALLVYLATEHQIVHSRETLMAAVLARGNDDQRPKQFAGHALAPARTSGQACCGWCTGHRSADHRPQQCTDHPAWIDRADVNCFNRLLERSHQHAHTTPQPGAALSGRPNRSRSALSG